MDEDMDEAKTQLWRVPTSLPRKMKKTSSQSNASIIGRRAIMPTIVFKRENKS